MGPHVDTGVIDPADRVAGVDTRDPLRDVELVPHRDDGDGDPGLFRQQPGPGAGRVNDDGGADLPLARRDAGHVPVLDANPGDARVGKEDGALLLGTNNSGSMT